MTVTVPASGKVLVTVTGGLSVATDDASAFMSFAVSGTDSAVAADTTALQFTGMHSDINQESATFMVTGLTSGASDTFTAKYRSSAAGSIASFQNRNIIVIPMP